MASTPAQYSSDKTEFSFAKETMSPVMNHFILPFMMTHLFLQAIREFIGQIYFQNLGAMSLGPSVLFVFLLLSPIAVPLLKRIGRENLLGLTIVGVILFRFMMPFLQTVSILYLVSAGLAVAFYGMYIPLAISMRFKGQTESLPASPVMFSTAFCLAIAADLTLRTLRVTWDPSAGPLGVLIAPTLCAFTALIAYESYLLSRGRLLPVESSKRSTSRFWMFTAGLGFGGVMFAVLTFLAYPNVIARWTASSYELAALSIILGLVAYALMTVNAAVKQLLMRRTVIMVVNLVALLAAIDLAYLLSPVAGILAGVTIFAFLLNLQLLWSFMSSRNASLTDYAIFHFAGMLLLLLFTLFYVLTFIAGQILPTLEGLSPYLILLSFVLAVAPTLILILGRKEVIA